MPVVHISLIKGRAAVQKRELLDQLHHALTETLKIPAHDRTQIVHEYAAEDFIVPPGKTNNYTLIEIMMFSGRSKDVKQALFSGIAERLSHIGISPADVFIILNEQPLDNWGIRGGQQASRVALGFNVDI